MNDIVTIISNVGFPISCVIFMGWFYYKVINNMNITLELLKDAIADLKKTMEDIQDKIK